MKRDDLLQPGMHNAFVRDGFGALPQPVEARHATLAMETRCFRATAAMIRARPWKRSQPPAA